MKLTQPDAMQFTGEFDTRLRHAIQNLQALDTDEMRREFTHPTPNWHWGADYMGRWIAVMAQLEAYTGEEYNAAGVARELLNFQEADGRFGSYSEPTDHKEWFGMGRGLIGLLEYYEIKQDPAVLAAAVRLGDYYVEHYPEIAPCMYECYANGLEGLVKLAQLTGEERHWRVARRVAETSMVYKRIWFSNDFLANGMRTPCSGHVHCQLLSVRGLLDLYEATGEERFRQPALDFYDMLMREMVWVSGGLGEFFDLPEHNEACADADWLRLNLQLWRLTGQPGYMDLAEHILLNQLYFSQADSGAFCYRRRLENGPGAAFDACCSHHGPRAMWEVMRYVCTTDERGVWVNFYLPGNSKLSVGGALLGLTCEVEETEREMQVALRVQAAPTGVLAMHLRVPEWAGQAGLRVNGAALPAASGPGYTTVERAWEAGDVLQVNFPLRVRIERGHRMGMHVTNPNEVAVFYGPRLLVLSARANPGPNLHLARLLPPAGDEAFRRLAAARLGAEGVTGDGQPAQFVLTPLAGVGGRVTDIGRIHPVVAPYFRVWIPVAE